VIGERSWKLPRVPDNAGWRIGWNPTSQGQRRDRPYGNLQPMWSGLMATSLTRALLPGDNLSLLTSHTLGHPASSTKLKLARRPWSVSRTLSSKSRRKRKSELFRGSPGK
jgi:hypothetical protein